MAMTEADANEMRGVEFRRARKEDAAEVLACLKRVIPILLITEGVEGALAEVLYQSGLSRDGATQRVPIPDADRWAIDRVLNDKRLSERVLIELCRIAPEFVTHMTQRMARDMEDRMRHDRGYYQSVRPVAGPIEVAPRYIPQAYPKRNS